MQRTTSRLILRPPHSDDLASAFAIHSDPATNQYNPAGPMTDISQAASVLGDWLRHWEEKGYGQWAIASRDDPQNIIRKVLRKLKDNSYIKLEIRRTIRMRRPVPERLR